MPTSGDSTNLSKLVIYVKLLSLIMTEVFSIASVT